MAGSDRPVQFGPWPKGMDNVSTDRAIPSGTLREASNVDIQEDGEVRLRSGTTSRVTGLAHSLASAGSVLLAVVNGALTSYTRNPAGGLSATVLRTGLSVTAKLGYAQIGPDMFYSNNAVNGKIVGGAHRPWGVERPGGQPVLTAVVAGALDVGRYKVAVTFVDALGEESGTGPSAVVSVAANGGISLTAIPQPTTPQVTKIRVYVSEANGAVMYRQGDYSVGTATTVITRSSTLGKVCDTQFMNPPVPGRLLEPFNGRIYVGRGNALYFTEPQRYGLMRENGFLLFEDEIRIIRAGEVGLWVVTASSTEFLAGSGPEDFEPQQRLAYGAARQTVTELPGGKLFWISDGGPVVANLQGQVEDLTDERNEPLLRVATQIGTRAATAYRDYDGVSQIIACIGGGRPSGLVAQDYTDLTGVYA